MEIARHKGRGATQNRKDNIICQNMALPELIFFPKLGIKSLKMRRIRKKKKNRILQKLNQHQIKFHLKYLPYFEIV